MKKTVVLLGLTLLLFTFALPAAAQAEGADGKPPAQVAMWIAITSGFAMAIASAGCAIAQAMAIASAGCAIAQAKATSAACEGMARNPGAAPAIRFALILALVLIESLALYTFAIVFLKVAY